jgi:hypothetical protein
VAPFSRPASSPVFGAERLSIYRSDTIRERSTWSAEEVSREAIPSDVSSLTATGSVAIPSIMPVRGVTAYAVSERRGKAGSAAMLLYTQVLVGCLPEVRWAGRR